MELLELLLTLLVAPAMLVGIAIGLLGAALLHWLAPAPEPLFAEAALVAMGFLGALLYGYWQMQQKQDARRKP